MLNKLNDTAQKAARFDPFSSIDSALQNQQNRIDELKACVETLKSVQECYDIATRHLGIGIAIISHTRQVLWANVFLTELVGNTGSGFCHFLLCGSNKPCPACRFEDVLAGKLFKATYPVALRDHNAQRIEADVTIIPILDTGKVVTGAIEIIMPTNVV